jgi:hypothetical protein
MRQQAPHRSTAVARIGRGMASIVGLAALAGAVAQACNVPVFRYALERWQPDPYRAVLFHRGPLTDQQQALLGQLEPAPGKSPANLAVRLVDVDAMEEVDRALWTAQGDVATPWLALQYPQSLRNDKTVWSGSLSEGELAKLMSSPLRTELVKRLSDGQTAVWLLLECGNAEKNQAVAAQLDAQLVELAGKLKLPELTGEPQDNLLSDAPLGVSFSLLRVPRGEAEQALVQMLLGAEPDLAEWDEPLVFPVFGRGRALLPLIGAGITADNIHESAAFLVGACSCEIKELNPGFDLLLTADWNVLLFKESPPPAAVPTAPPGKPELVAIPSGAAPVETIPTAYREESRDFTGIAIAGLLLAATVVVVAFKRFA